MIAKRLVALLSAILLLSSYAVAGEANPDSRAAIERLKSLVGTWQSVTKGATAAPQSVTYSMTGGGNVLVEDMRDPNGVGGMMTAYHLDKDTLVLTHFCGAGNQPRMRITSADERHITFAMFDITNLSDPQAYHSTSLEIVFRGRDRVDLVYGGKAAGKDTTQVFELTRKAK
jgi:hypothetical protein